MNVHDLQFIEDYLKLLSQPLAEIYEESYENAVQALGVHVPTGQTT
jgi:hypothetical protein